MTIEIMDPVTLGLSGAAGPVGTTVGSSTKRKYTKVTAFNGTGGPATLRIFLVPDGFPVTVLTQYVDYDMAVKETYNCPECIGAALLAGGKMYASGAGISLSSVSSDLLNS